MPCHFTNGERVSRGVKSMEMKRLMFVGGISFHLKRVDTIANRSVVQRTTSVSHAVGMRVAEDGRHAVIINKRCHA